jgi:hypothetical protein
MTTGHPLTVDLTGSPPFGQLTVLRRVPNSLSRWICLCECGNEIECIAAKLLDGSRRTCGNCGEAIISSPRPLTQPVRDKIHQITDLKIVKHFLDSGGDHSRLVIINIGSLCLKLNGDGKDEL